MKKKITAVLLLAALAMTGIAACGSRGAKNDIVLQNTQGASSGGTEQNADDTQSGQDTQGAQDAPDNMGSSGASDDAALTELEGILGEISASVEVGTAGASLKAVPVTLTLMDWASKYEVDDAAVQSCALQYLDGLGEDVREEFGMQFELVYTDSQELMEPSGRALIDDSGCDAPNYPYDASGLTELEALHSAIQNG